VNQRHGIPASKLLFVYSTVSHGETAALRQEGSNLIWNRQLRAYLLYISFCTITISLDTSGSPWYKHEPYLKSAKDYKWDCTIINPKYISDECKFSEKKLGNDTSMVSEKEKLLFPWNKWYFEKVLGQWGHQT